jgi:two-component system, cell cycle sensor histidine kinase and response regulator CckA
MTRPQILIVEDDSIIAMELEDRLQSLGYGVCAATPSGKDAVEKAGDMWPDLILMDIWLDGLMDGVEAAAEIRARFDIPVVYLTAYADKDTLQRAKVTEPYGYIIKPFEERELQTAIEIALYKHRMERKLKESELWLTATLRSISDAIIATGPTGMVVFMNPTAETLTGWKSADALDRGVAQVFRTIDEVRRTVLEDPVARSLRESFTVVLADRLLVTQNGKEIPIDGSTALIRNEKGAVAGVVLVFRDVSERKRQEEERTNLQGQLFHAQKMEAVGVLTGGLAHDFNNLMTTVIGYSSLILSHLGDQDPLRRGVQFIKKAGERAASLTQQILALSRKQMSEPEVLDLNAVVIDLEEMLHRLVGEDTEVVSSLEPGFRYVKADPAQVEQILMNLLVNAHEAMPGGGKLTIKTETVALDEEQCRCMPKASPGTFVRLSVTDTGIGMDEETLQHIFEPFFSTKEKGTGLGLSIANNIVEHYDGWIEVYSALEEGSTFQVYLPAFVGDAGEKPQVDKLSPRLLGGGERILLVEDNEGVRAAVSEMLRSSGYVVVEAASAAEGLDIFDRERGDFFLVFSDVVLPDRDGLQLVNQLLCQNPKISVLFTSGYADQRSQWPIIHEKGYGFLRKPFGLAELLPAVEEMLRRYREGTGGNAEHW